MSSIKKFSRSINARMITASAFITLRLFLQHDETIEIMKKTELAEKEDRSIIELNFLCDSQTIQVF